MSIEGLKILTLLLLTLEWPFHAQIRKISPARCARGLIVQTLTLLEIPTVLGAYCNVTQLKLKRVRIYALPVRAPGLKLSTQPARTRLISMCVSSMYDDRRSWASYDLNEPLMMVTDLDPLMK